MSRGTELERIALLAATFGRPSTGIGIGDDAAIVEPVTEPLVWTIDAQVEGTHFQIDWLTWWEVGWRSFMAAASDLAAMGASPLAALSALSLGPGVEDDDLEQLAKGQAEAARMIGAVVIGGNLARGTETSVTTTLLGRAAKPVLRSGAQPGDGLYLAGAIGLAHAGLMLLQRGGPDVKPEPWQASALSAWRRPIARIDAGKGMAPTATAGIDISDGLARDAHHIAEASHVALVIEETALRGLASGLLTRGATALSVDVLDLMLTGGEDYALLVTSPQPINGFTRIGHVVVGAPEVLLARDLAHGGAYEPLPPRGFDHFSS